GRRDEDRVRIDEIRLALTVLDRFGGNSTDLAEAADLATGFGGHLLGDGIGARLGCLVCVAFIGRALDRLAGIVTNRARARLARRGAFDPGPRATTSTAAAAAPARAASFRCAVAGRFLFAFVGCRRGRGHGWAGAILDRSFQRSRASLVE